MNNQTMKNRYERIQPKEKRAGPYTKQTEMINSKKSNRNVSDDKKQTPHHIIRSKNHFFYEYDDERKLYMIECCIYTPNKNKYPDFLNDFKYRNGKMCQYHWIKVKDAPDEKQAHLTALSCERQFGQIVNECEYNNEWDKFPFKYEPVYSD